MDSSSLFNKSLIEEDEKDDQQNNFFDHILETKIKSGKSQAFSTLGLALLWLADGAEMLVLGFILPVLENEWEISSWQSNLLGSSVFLFWGLAAISVGKYADTYGRRMPILVSAFGQAITAFLSAFSQNYTQLLILRAAFAYFMGLANPISAAYVSELYPKQERGFIFSLVYNMFPFGEMITVAVAYYCLPTLHTGDWRLLLIWSSIPGIIAYVVAYYYLIESPRFLLISKHHGDAHQRAFKLIDEMGAKNHSEDYIPLNEEEKQSLQNWATNQVENQKKHQAHISSLFSKDYFNLTVKTMIMWFSLSFIFYGLVFQLPTILFKIHASNGQEYTESNDSDFFGIFLTALVEIPSCILGYYLQEHKNFGRKLTLSWGYTICGLACFIVYFHPNDDSLFFFLIAIVKFSINVCFLVCFTFTAEIYPTSMRATAVGTNNSVCRLGGVMMPWLSLLFYFFGNTGPLLICAIICALSAFSAFTIPKDTKNMVLDTYIEMDDKNVLNEPLNVDKV